MALRDSMTMKMKQKKTETRKTVHDIAVALDQVCEYV